MDYNYSIEHGTSDLVTFLNENNTCLCKDFREFRQAKTTLKNTYNLTGIQLNKIFFHIFFLFNI